LRDEMVGEGCRQGEKGTKGSGRGRGMRRYGRGEDRRGRERAVEEVQVRGAYEAAAEGG